MVMQWTIWDSFPLFLASETTSGLIDPDSSTNVFSHIFFLGRT